MSQPNQMSAEEFRQQFAKPTGPDALSAAEFREQANAKAKPDTYTAAEFRRQHVDQDEHSLQARCVGWFRMKYPNLLLFAVPNAAKRSPQLANMLEAEGMVSGVPDLVVAFPTDEYPGLYIEMKTNRKGSKPSDEQIKIQAYLVAVGYRVIMPRTFEEFEQQVNEYLTDYEHQSKETGTDTPKMWRTLRLLRQTGNAETDAGRPHDASEQPITVSSAHRWKTGGDGP